MKADPPNALKIAIVAGEESGDILGAELVSALRTISGGPVDLIGVGGSHLAEQGLKSLFDPSEIALMGISEILLKIPRLLSLVRSTAAEIISLKPDVLIIIDSPEFTHRVARKVKSALPNLPVLNYVSPSVWAWRPGRAKTMRGYIDHILAILPFEPDAIAKLDGPPATYVGHRLASAADMQAAFDAQHALEQTRFSSESRTVLLLPGSRRGEIRRSLPVMKSVVEQWAERKRDYRLVLPTFDWLETDVRSAIKDWAIVPEVVTGLDAKMQHFASCDAALAASGTVTLELALCAIPTVAFYKLDAIASMIVPRLFVGWSASLPNLIADEPLVPESYNAEATAGNLARQIEKILVQGPARQAQVAGFKRLRDRMATTEPPSVLAARIVLDFASRPQV